MIYAINIYLDTFIYIIYIFIYMYIYIHTYETIYMCKHVCISMHMITNRICTHTYACMSVSMPCSSGRMTAVVALTTPYLKYMAMRYLVGGKLPLIHERLSAAVHARFFPSLPSLTVTPFYTFQGPLRQ